jgi:hypothetical protein
MRLLEDLPVFTVLPRIDDGSFISEILLPFLDAGCPDDLPRRGTFFAV